MLEAHQPQSRWTVHEQGAAPAEVHAQRHHQSLAQRIDRRGRHPPEAPAEEGGHALGQGRQRGERGVGPPAPDRTPPRVPPPPPPPTPNPPTPTPRQPARPALPP